VAADGDGDAVTGQWAAAGLLGLLLGGLPAEDGMSDEREAEAVVDAVYRALLVEAAPAAAEVVCVVVRRTVDGKEQVGDPSAEHLSRLQKENPNVRNGSACKRGRGQPATEAATGASAVVLDIGPVEWRGAAAARAGGGFSRGGWGTVESEYDLVKTAGAWTVERTTRKRTT
jgi:hypothetical protein